ncbi:unnamed protein product, partial [Discosporangium mesarthrocarpum]
AVAAGRFQRRNTPSPQTMSLGNGGNCGEHNQAMATEPPELGVGSTWDRATTSGKGEPHPQEKALGIPQGHSLGHTGHGGRRTGAGRPPAPRHPYSGEYNERGYNLYSGGG